MNNTTSESIDHFTTFELAFYIGNGFFGALFNMIVLFIAIRHIDTDDKPRQIIVMNMTAADLLFCLSYVLSRPFLEGFPTIACHPYYVTIWTVQMCSCMNLLWLNVDKLLFIQFPLHYYSIVNRKRVMTLSIATWVVLIGCALAVDANMLIKDSCLQLMINPYIYLPICIFYVVVIYASFAISAVIFFIAQTSTKMEKRQRTKLFQRLFFLFSSTMCTFITCLPYRGLYLLHMLCHSCQAEWLTLVVNLFFRLLVVGTVINPIITIMTQRIYRTRLLQYVNRWQKVSTNSEETSASYARRQSSKCTIETSPLTTSL